jgi:hypothetical protein
LPVVAGKGNGGVGNSPRGSPELGERRSGWATRVKWWRRWGSTGAFFGVREEERGAVRGAESLRVEVAFYRGWGVPGDNHGRHRRRNGGRVNGDSSVVMLRFNGGVMATI